MTTSTMAKEQMSVVEHPQKPQPTKGNRCGITMSTSSAMSVNAMSVNHSFGNIYNMQARACGVRTRTEREKIACVLIIVGFFFQLMGHRISISIFSQILLSLYRTSYYYRFLNRAAHGPLNRTQGVGSIVNCRYF